jgi:hypothetical protein
MNMDEVETARIPKKIARAGGISGREWSGIFFTNEQIPLDKDYIEG